MRLSDLDIDKMTVAQYGRLKSTANKSKRDELDSLLKLVKDNNINLSQLDKEMYKMAVEMSKDEIEQEFVSRMKQFFASCGSNYELEKQLKQHRMNQRAARRD